MVVEMIERSVRIAGVVFRSVSPDCPLGMSHSQGLHILHHARYDAASWIASVERHTGIVESEGCL